MTRRAWLAWGGLATLAAGLAFLAYALFGVGLDDYVVTGSAAEGMEGIAVRAVADAVEQYRRALGASGLLLALVGAGVLAWAALARDATETRAS